MNLHRILAGAAAVMTAAATLQAAPPPATLDQAAEAYARLDLDEARTILGRIKKDETGEGARLKQRILLATNMMERVENVEILDSATVAADDFFNAVRLAPATGRLTDSGALVKPLQGQPARSSPKTARQSSGPDMTKTPTNSSTPSTNRCAWPTAHGPPPGRCLPARQFSRTARPAPWPLPS